MNKTALIIGIRGQDGSILADLLLSKGYFVIGLERKVSNPNYSNLTLALLNENFKLETGDITDFTSLISIFEKYDIDECYNFAAVSHIPTSIEQPALTHTVNTMGVMNCLEVIRLISPKTKFFQPSTTDVYGRTHCCIANINSKVDPQSPYAASKVNAETLVNNYRNTYGLFSCYARSSNHTSYRQPKSFVIRKITDYVSKISQGYILPELTLGDLSAKRDFLSAYDVIQGIHLMMQKDMPDNYLFASGVRHSIKDVLDIAFKSVNLDWAEYVKVDQSLIRKTEIKVPFLDASKAYSELAWKPKINFEEMILDIIKNDVELNKVKS